MSRIAKLALLALAVTAVWATPHASGTTAIIWDGNETATAAQIVTRLDAATDDLGAAGRDSSFGFGRVNLVKAATG
jgi:subtilisin family serine protease